MDPPPLLWAKVLWAAKYVWHGPVNHSAYIPESGNTLDLLLTTKSDWVGEVLIDSPLPACEHCQIVFDYVFETVNAIGSDEGGHKIKANDCGIKVGFHNECGLIEHWLGFSTYILECSDSYDRFKSVVTNIMHRFVPTKSNQPEKVMCLGRRVQPPDSFDNVSKYGMLIICLPSHKMYLLEVTNLTCAQWQSQPPLPWCGEGGGGQNDHNS